MYTHMYLPLIAACENFIKKIKSDYNFINPPPNPANRVHLIKIHEQANSWLVKYLQKMF